jgi:hypothetical protein
MTVSNLRIFWIVWCSMWALGWLLAGFVTFGLAWAGIPASLLAILLPVGGGRQEAPQLALPPGHPVWRNPNAPPQLPPPPSSVYDRRYYR